MDSRFSDEGGGRAECEIGEDITDEVGDVRDRSRVF